MRWVVIPEVLQIALGRLEKGGTRILTLVELSTPDNKETPGIEATPENKAQELGAEFRQSELIPRPSIPSSCVSYQAQGPKRCHEGGAGRL